jgi:prevent-host-death family protein
MRVEVGVRELRENLSDWLDRAAAGEEILVTERGKAKAVITAAESAWDRMVREGRITPRTGTGPRRPLPPPVKWDGEGPTLTDYLMYNRGKIPWPGPGPEPGAEDAEA